MKTMMLSFKEQIMNHPYMVSFFALLSTLLRFVVESWQVDGVLFIFLFFLVAIDTYTGVRLAKKTDIYDYKLLKEKAIKKVMGYVIFLMALWTFTMMLFVMNIKDGVAFVDNYYLNIPMMTAMLFFAGIEFLSIKDNVTRIFGVRVPATFIDKVESFISSGGDIGKLTENKGQSNTQNP